MAQPVINQDQNSKYKKITVISSKLSERNKSILSKNSNNPFCLPSTGQDIFFLQTHKKLEDKKDSKRRKSNITILNETVRKHDMINKTTITNDEKANNFIDNMLKIEKNLFNPNYEKNKSNRSLYVTDVNIEKRDLLPDIVLEKKVVISKEPMSVSVKKFIENTREIQLLNYQAKIKQELKDRLIDKKRSKIDSANEQYIYLLDLRKNFINFNNQFVNYCRIIEKQKKFLQYQYILKREEKLHQEIEIRKKEYELISKKETINKLASIKYFFIKIRERLKNLPIIDDFFNNSKYTKLELEDLFINFYEQRLLEQENLNKAVSGISSKLKNSITIRKRSTLIEVNSKISNSLTENSEVSSNKSNRSNRSSSHNNNDRLEHKNNNKQRNSKIVKINIVNGNQSKRKKSFYTSNTLDKVQPSNSTTRSPSFLISHDTYLTILFKKQRNEEDNYPNKYNSQYFQKIKKIISYLKNKTTIFSNIKEIYIEITKMEEEAQDLLIKRNTSNDLIFALKRDNDQLKQKQLKTHEIFLNTKNQKEEELKGIKARNHELKKILETYNKMLEINTGMNKSIINRVKSQIKENINLTFKLQTSKNQIKHKNDTDSYSMVNGYIMTLFLNTRWLIENTKYFNNLAKYEEYKLLIRNISIEFSEEHIIESTCILEKVINFLIDRRDYYIQNANNLYLKSVDKTEKNKKRENTIKQMQENKDKAENVAEKLKEKFEKLVGDKIKKIPSRFKPSEYKISNEKEVNKSSDYNNDMNDLLFYN